MGGGGGGVQICIHFKLRRNCFGRDVVEQGVEQGVMNRRHTENLMNQCFCT